MKVFISWSGPQAQSMAEALQDWLKKIIQAVEPFVSTQAIQAGDRGLNVIRDWLTESSCGIVCVTRANRESMWINFEAGALSKALDGKVMPILLDLSVADLTGPLSQFQASSGTDKKAMSKMVRSLRDHGGLTFPDDPTLESLFDAFWPDLERRFREIAGEHAARDTAPLRKDREVLDEIVLLLRDLNKRPPVQNVVYTEASTPTRDDGPDDFIRLVAGDIPLPVAALRDGDVSGNRAHMTMHLKYLPTYVPDPLPSWFFDQLTKTAVRWRLTLMVTTDEGYEFHASPTTVPIMRKPRASTSDETYPTVVIDRDGAPE
jgi:hypothetical protein